MLVFPQYGRVDVESNVCTIKNNVIRATPDGSQCLKSKRGATFTSTLSIQFQVDDKWGFLEYSISFSQERRFKLICVCETARARRFVIESIYTCATCAQPCMLGLFINI